jgi:hypothetical protein
MDRIPLVIEFENVVYKGFIYPQVVEGESFPQFFRIILNDTYMGDLTYSPTIWIAESPLPPDFVTLIIEYIIIYFG